MMASNLPLEFQRFCKQTKYLRQLLRDTQRCFGEISSAACLNSDGQLVSAELRTNEIEDIEAIVKQPPCLVIYGQTCAAKAHIVNDIFNREILPVPVKREGTSGKPWRALRFRYGEETTVSLSLPDNFEMVNILSSYNKSKKTLAIEDIEISPENNTASSSAVLEVRLNHPLVQDGGLVVVSPSADQSPGLFDLHDKYSQDAVPIILYALAKNSLTEKELSELSVLREKVPDIAIFFVKVPSERPGIEPDSLSDRIVRKITRSGSGGDHSNRQDYGSRFFNSRGTLNLFQQLCNIGYLSILPASAALKPMIEDIDNYTVDSELIENYDHFVNLLNFTRRVLQSYLIKTTSLLNLVHTRCLQTFIMTAFDMARDMMITPRRLEFAKEKESHLYESLMEIASKKQVEIREIIGETIQDMRAGLLDKAASYDFIGVNIAESGEVTSSRELKICTGQIQDLVLGSLNSAIAGKLLGSVDILKDSYTGVLTRCLESLEQSSKETSTESIKTSLALKEILNAAYQVEITVRAGASLVRVLLEKMKQLIHSMPWRTPPKIDEEWKRRVAAEMLDSLNEARLARSICSQIRERLKNSHETFAVALRQLEARHSGRLEKTEEQRLRLRKNFAPRVAKLVLESTSMKDYILFGMPHLGREIGRGQYGVVYSCDAWAGYNPCAIKTVVPPDDKHWNDLALEFYYTKNVPEHERIVALLGSVIDYTYGGGPAVLLIMDRLERDLYMAIKSGLNWMNRLQVAIDVIEGIRFLHSQGLVHRDIKLKNVLLDKSNRAKLTDLGFCKPEAMMSGSIVGTPIHMAPELFTGRYDNSVDVYAFGILFWYICAGHVKLPFAFEQCTNKEMLWTSVKRGMRPERLPQFDEECWKMMQHCWDGDQAKRPLLGTVEPQLRSIMERCATQKQPGHRSSSSSPTKRHPPTARNPDNSKS